MTDDFSLIPMQICRADTLRELRACAEEEARSGLALSDAEMEELAATREKALSDAGRVEFGGGILPKLIRTFCDSPYAERETWAETLEELQAEFYYFKSEAEDRLSDEELLDCMVKVFNGRAQGSTEYLSGTSLETLCRLARQGWSPQDGEEAGDLF